MTGRNFSSKSIEQLYVQLQSSDKGISTALAEQRTKVQLKFFKKEPRFKRELKLLIRQFTNPLVLLLVIAVILSAVLGESSDSLIILFILIITGLLGFWQELNAGRAMEKLRNMIEMKHTVLRDGQQLQLTTHQIVTGDILLFDAGDIIPADCRIIESKNPISQLAILGMELMMWRLLTQPTSVYLPIMLQMSLRKRPILSYWKKIFLF